MFYYSTIQTSILFQSRFPRKATYVTSHIFTFSIQQITGFSREAENRTPKTKNWLRCKKRERLKFLSNHCYLESWSKFVIYFNETVFPRKLCFAGHDICIYPVITFFWSGMFLHLWLDSTNESRKVFWFNEYVRASLWYASLYSWCFQKLFRRIISVNTCMIKKKHAFSFLNN